MTTEATAGAESGRRAAVLSPGRNRLLPAALLSLVGGPVAADPGLSSVGTLGFLYLLIGAVIALIAAPGFFWVRMTWRYLGGAGARFHRLKTYLALTAAIVLISGAGAFTFHADAPYSQNLCFLAVMIGALVASASALVVQFRRPR